MTSAELDPKLIIALDFDSQSPVLRLCDQLDPRQCRMKVGKELFTALGPDIVRQIMNRGFDVFLDLKFHDIPATVAKACKSAADMGVWLLNVHASGGQRMMVEAGETLVKGGYETRLIAVTVLTSMGQEDLDQLGINTAIADQVLLLARLAQQSGLQGVVCSAQESQMLRQEMETKYLTKEKDLQISLQDL